MVVKILRSIVGVVVGYLLFAISGFQLFQLTGRKPHQPQDVPFMLFSVAYGMVFACAGGYLASVVAGRSPKVHAGVMAAILAAGATVSLLSSASGGSGWSQIAAVVLMAPSAFVGGVLRSKRQTS